MPSFRTFSELPTTHTIVFSRAFRKVNPNAQKVGEKSVIFRFTAKIGSTDSV